jgi:phosphoglycolate phosphatase-like HAD superfamily hydrolase
MRALSGATDQLTGSGSARAPGVLALDFDGVICDSWRECAFITWAGQHGWAPSEFAASAFPAIPGAFIQRFLALRGYARHLGHFLVPVLPGSERISCRADFDLYYAGLAPEEVATFVERALRFRASVQNRRWKQWLAFHVLYEGVSELLSPLSDRLYIVTARDRQLVRELLATHGIAVQPERIYSERCSKSAALRDIQAREHAGVYFVDDDLDDVVAAQRDGYRAVWALWGYSAPEDRAKASRLGIPVLSLPELPAAVLSVIGDPADPAHPQAS